MDEGTDIVVLYDLRIYVLCGADVPPYILLDSWASLMVFTVSTVLGTPHHALEEDQMIAPAAQEAQQQHQNRQNNLYRWAGHNLKGTTKES